jgi:Ca-activated chloride channel family protein
MRPVAILIAVVALLVQAELGWAQVFRARAELVHLPVVVTDRRGEVVTGLTAEDFEVVDGGQVRPISAFIEGAPPATMGVPLYLGAMFDRSASMEQDSRAAAEALIDLIDAMPEAADVTLVEFDAAIRVSRFSPDSYPRLFARVRSPEPPGRETALFDAVARYVGVTRDREGLHLLVVFTDGGDSGRGIHFDDLSGLLDASNVLMHAVVYLEHEPLADVRGRQRYLMTRLAERTGGEAFFPSSRREIGEIYDRIRRLIESRYTIGYALPPEARPGQFREVLVRLARPEHRNLRVRTRAGYAVPEP